MSKKIAIIFILLLSSSCARWNEPTIPLPKRTILTITASFVGNVNSTDGSYFIIFDNDNDVDGVDGPYIDVNTNRWINTTHYIKLKNGRFYFGTMPPSVEEPPKEEPFIAEPESGNKIIIQIDISTYFGNIQCLQINVVTLDKDNNVIDMLDENKEIRNAYISYNISEQFPTLTLDNENDAVGEGFKHLNIKEVRIEKSIN